MPRTAWDSWGTGGNVQARRSTINRYFTMGYGTLGEFHGMVLVPGECWRAFGSRAVRWRPSGAWRTVVKPNWRAPAQHPSMRPRWSVGAWWPRSMARAGLWSADRSGDVSGCRRRCGSHYRDGDGGRGGCRCRRSGSLPQQRPARVDDPSGSEWRRSGLRLSRTPLGCRPRGRRSGRLPGDPVIEGRVCEDDRIVAMESATERGG